MRRAIAVLAIAVVAIAASVLTPLAGRADPLTDADLQKVFEDGLDRFDEGDATGAIDLWAPLVEAEPDRAWRANYNLGLAYESVGDAPNAVSAYDKFVRRVGQMPGVVPEQVEERRQDAVDRATRLKASLGVLRVSADAPIAGVVVSIDGGPRRTLPVDTYLVPGPHRVVAIAADREKAYDATVQKGVTSGVVILAADLAPEPVDPPPNPIVVAPPRKPDAPPGFPVAWVVAGAGITALSFAFPIGFGIDAWNQGNAAGALGVGHTGYEAAREEYVSARTRYYATYAVPAVLGAATATIAIVGAVRVATASKEAVDVAVVPLASPGTLDPTGALVSLSMHP